MNSFVSFIICLQKDQYNLIVEIVYLVQLALIGYTHVSIIFLNHLLFISIFSFQY